MIRATLIVLALVGAFVFPVFLTLALALSASFFFPVAALAVGVLYDLLYLSPNTVPWGALIGALGMFIMMFVRAFAARRIIGQ